MPPIEEIAIDETESETVAKPVIGIIYPPPEVRNIVDKTASFVARNGPEFETRIRQNEINNPKFNFLNQADPYHAYYQHKVKEFREGRGQEPAAPKLPLGLLQKPQQAEQAKIIQDIIPKEPPPEFEFIADPPSISAFDLDVVKLTAQFVARNGRQFLTNLMNREQRNYQFDFLRPQHSLFNYFTKLVEQYTKILIPPKDLLPKLRKESDDPKVALEQSKRRVEWARYQERERQKEAEEKERERVSYAQIDWHDFVVVETVDFQPNEQGNLPPPTTPDEVGARLLAQERFEDKEAETVEMEVESEDEEEDDDEEVTKSKPKPALAQPEDVDTQIQDMEEESDEELSDLDDDLPPMPSQPPPPPPPKDTPQPPPLPPTPGEVIIKDYNPKAAKQVAVVPSEDKFLVSPITGEKIAADKIQKHIQIGLLDPKWREQQEKMVTEKRGQEEVYAPGSAIDSSLKQLAERRTDIFGSGAEEAQIGKKIGEEEKRKSEKVIWDGHTASMEKVTQKARENISIEQQIAVIHKAKGLLPDEDKEKIGPTVPKPPSMPAPKPPPPPPASKAPPLPGSAPKSAGAIPPKQLMSQPMSKPIPPPPSQPPRSTPVPMPPQPPPMMVMGQGPMGPPQQMGGPMMGRPPMPPMMPRPPMGGPMGPRPFMGGHPPHPPPPKHVEKDDEEPPAKKAKSEDQLIPEADFLKNHPTPVSFRVTIPKLPEKGEWKLNGQTLNLTLPLTDNVSVIKAKLHESLGMPAGKQKLQFDGMFIKDSNTLAFYNFTPNSVMSLQLKERGGRRK